MAQTLYQSLLPSGRAVRVARLRTQQYLAIQQRVSAKVGDRKDPGGGLAKSFAAIDIVATCLKEITAKPLVLKYREVPPTPEELEAAPDAKPRTELDIDATLAGATKDCWVQVTYGELVKRDGEQSIDALLDEVPDFDHVVALAMGAGVTDPTKGMNLLGKAQVISAG